jgi:hypothetical protein
MPLEPYNAATCDRTLIRINSQTGQSILPPGQVVPCRSSLYRDCAGGVWVHVHIEKRQRCTSKDDREHLSPGIWYIAPFEATRVVCDVSHVAKINMDGSRTGLLILSPMVEGNDEGGGAVEDNSSLFVHVGPVGELHRRVIPINFFEVAAVLDDGERRALLHCRSNDKNVWKLYRVAWELVDEETGEVNEALVEFVDCPGRTKLVTDGRGGVWVWKKVGKHNNRAISYISQNGELIEGRGESFPGGAVIEG